MNKYWEIMRDKAAGNIHSITKCEVTCEHSLKKAVAKVLRNGTCLEAADVIVEASEWMTAYLNLKAICNNGDIFVSC